MRKIILIFLAIIIILNSGCGKKEEKTQLEKIIDRDVLIVGVSTDSKPFGFKNTKTGKIEGFDIDIAREAAKDILGSERKIDFVPITPSGRIEAITSGRVDMVAATMTITPQRELLIDFTEPYFIAGQTALVKKDSKIYNFADLKNKTIIIALGTTSEKNIRRILPIAKLNGYNNYKEAFEAFKNGYGDAFSTDNTILSGFLDENDSYRILKNKISQEPYAFGIKKCDNDDSLKSTLNYTIKRMKNDGTILNLKKKWKIN